MTADDANEARQLLLAAGVEEAQITPEAIAIANALINTLMRRVAQQLAQRLFPDEVEPALSH